MAALTATTRYNVCILHSLAELSKRSPKGEPYRQCNELINQRRTTCVLINHCLRTVEAQVMSQIQNGWFGQTCEHTSFEQKDQPLVISETLIA